MLSSYLILVRTSEWNDP